MEKRVSESLPSILIPYKTLASVLWCLWERSLEKKPAEQRVSVSAGVRGPHPVPAISEQHLVCVLSRILRNSCAISPKLLAVLDKLYIHIRNWVKGACFSVLAEGCSSVPQTLYLVKPPKN